MDLSRRGLLAGAAAALLVGCTKHEPGAKSAGSVAPTPTPTPTPTPEPVPVWPLTGVPIEAGEEAKADHVAVALKISDVQDAHPQRGLNDADIVFCEANGVAYTRLCAVFHSKFPKWAGPIRSIRPVDVPLLAPMKAAFGNTEAADWVMKYVAEFKKYIDNLYFFKVNGTRSYEIVGGAKALEHRVFCHPKTLGKQSKFTAAPQSYFNWAQPGVESQVVNGDDVKKVTIPYGTGTDYAMKYTYNSDGLYDRSEPWGKHVLADGKRVTAQNVLILRCKWKMRKIHSGSGAKDPVYSMIDGHGVGWLLSGGKKLPINWAKGAAETLFTLTLKDGTPLLLPPGRTWVELPQKKAKVKFA
ncbi:MAG: DUF3048 domain-containing protein [Propionibacteriaceae bacterium]|jgi:hypothetical protein|nr:DUF3048 domain-containing protein [Propionibacteriaceae bacterium]